MEGGLCRDAGATKVRIKKSWVGSTVVPRTATSGVVLLKGTWYFVLTRV